MHGNVDAAPSKEEKTSWFGGGAGGRQQTERHDKADSWFGWSDGKQQDEKHWTDWMPAHKNDRMEKKGKLVKAAAFGKDHDILLLPKRALSDVS